MPLWETAISGFACRNFGLTVPIVLFVRRTNSYRSVSAVPFAAEEWLFSATSLVDVGDPDRRFEYYLLRHPQVIDLNRYLDEGVIPAEVRHSWGDSGLQRRVITPSKEAIAHNSLAPILTVRFEVGWLMIVAANCNVVW